MSLKQQLQDEMKQSMKSGERMKLDVIRFLLSKIKNVEIDEGELDDAGIQKVIAREVKQSKEAMEQFQQGGRSDLVQSEQAKVALMEVYLPEAISEDELLKLIDATIESQGKQMGAVIGAVMAQAQGRADGGLVARLVKERLAAA